MESEPSHPSPTPSHPVPVPRPAEAAIDPAARLEALLFEMRKVIVGQDRAL